MDPPTTDRGDASANRAETLDATGLRCPFPILKARHRLARMKDGAVLTLLADDPAAVVDVMHFCAEGGHKLVAERHATDGVRVFDIRKGG